jgi:putative Holliday junction resolvase
MNYLSLDFGTKRIGMAISENGFISTLPVLKNDETIFGKIQQIASQYQVCKIYVGLSSGKIASLTQSFVNRLSTMLELPIETIEEHVSTIEADELYLHNKGKKKNYKNSIDSISAAVILRRVVG